jgi:hypothetical protein
MINWKLISNPFNWTIVLLMVWIGAIGIKIVADYINKEKGIK